MIYYLLAYSFALIIAFYIIFVGYSKIRLKFWKSQPVFHCYNLFYWLSPPGIISFDLPPANKYLNI
jgi:choline-glycine betaine transporter